HEPSLLLTRVGEDLGGDEVERELLDAASTLGSGTRVIAAWPLPGEAIDHKRPTRPRIEGHAGRLAAAEARLCVYLHGVGDPGNVGSIVRTTGALVDAYVALGPDCADPFGPKAVRASMGAIFAVPVAHRDLRDTPSPRLSLVAHGGEAEAMAGVRTLCLGSEREGLPQAVIDASDATWTIPLRPEAVESLGVAAAAAIALGRIGSRDGEIG
ncbi:MAG: RNA methyltransferase, partial [Actinomycetota bacterium]|nr:RNA methyltransferase [Actinomycetota bacterium]